MADLYVGFLDPSNIEVIEGLTGSLTLNILIQSPSIQAADRAMNFDRKAILLSLDQVLIDHVPLFLRLIAQFNEAGTKPITISDLGDPWRNDTTPLLGSARADLQALSRDQNQAGV